MVYRGRANGCRIGAGWGRYLVLIGYSWSCETQWHNAYARWVLELYIATAADGDSTQISVMWEALTQPMLMSVFEGI